MTQQTAEHTLERTLITSLSALLMLAACVAVIAYQVSPLRDPSFVREAANASATVSWLAPERYWLGLIYVWTVTLATNVVALAVVQSLRIRAAGQTVRRDFLGAALRIFGLALRIFGLAGLWVAVAVGGWLGSLVFLLNQHIMD